MTNLNLIGVIGSGQCDETVTQLAYEVGREIAGTGYGLICGGLGGVMEGACRGAAEAGGLTVGILPGDSPQTANPYVRIPIATGLGIARNIVIVRSARAAIAIHGGPGTLSEIAFCLQLGVPVISLNSFSVSPDIIQAASPREAVEQAVWRITQ
jgi:uncharacterized protein (TIGR00725 family)